MFVLSEEGLLAILFAVMQNFFSDLKKITLRPLLLLEERREKTIKLKPHREWMFVSIFTTFEIAHFPPQKMHEKLVCIVN